MNSYYFERGKKLPIVFDVDVAVAGGGCAGTMAAVAAARNGVSTLLIERYGFLGGAATAQYVPLLSIWNLSFSWKNLRHCSKEKRCSCESVKR